MFYELQKRPDEEILVVFEEAAAPRHVLGESLAGRSADKHIELPWAQFQTLGHFSRIKYGEICFDCLCAAVIALKNSLARSTNCLGPR